MESNPRVPKKRLTSVGVLCELTKCKSQEHFLYGVQGKAILELDKELVTGNDGTEAQLLSEIELMLTEYPQCFNQDKRKVQQDIYILQEKLKNLKSMANNVDKYDLKTYRCAVLEIENTLTEQSNKNRLRMAKLKCDYMDLVSTLPETSELLKEESKFVPKRAPKSKKNVDDDQRGSRDYTEVQAFDRFLQSHGGHTGGWNDEQHSIYLSLRTRYRNNVERIKEAFQELLPGKRVDSGGS